MSKKKISCFAEIIQREIVKAGGQQELEETIAVAQTTISDYARGNTLPSARRAMMICRLLELDEKKVITVLDRDRALFAARNKRAKQSPIQKLAAVSAAAIEKEKDKST